MLDLDGFQNGNQTCLVSFSGALVKICKNVNVQMLCDELGYPLALLGFLIPIVPCMPFSTLLKLKSCFVSSKAIGTSNEQPPQKPPKR